MAPRATGSGTSSTSLDGSETGAQLARQASGPCHRPGQPDVHEQPAHAARQREQRAARTGRRPSAGDPVRRRRGRRTARAGRCASGPRSQRWTSATRASAPSSETSPGGRPRSGWRRRAVERRPASTASAEGPWIGQQSIRIEARHGDERDVGGHDARQLGTTSTRACAARAACRDGDGDRGRDAIDEDDAARLAGARREHLEGQATGPRPALRGRARRGSNGSPDDGRHGRASLPLAQREVLRRDRARRVRCAAPARPTRARRPSSRPAVGRRHGWRGRCRRRSRSGPRAGARTRSASTGPLTTSGRLTAHWPHRRSWRCRRRSARRSGRPPRAARGAPRPC